MIAAAAAAYAVWRMLHRSGEARDPAAAPSPDARFEAASAGPRPVWLVIDAACRQALKDKGRGDFNLDATLGDKGYGFTKAHVKDLAERALAIAAAELGIPTPAVPALYPTDALFEGTLGGLIADLEKRLKP